MNLSESSQDPAQPGVPEIAVEPVLEGPSTPSPGTPTNASSPGRLLPTALAAGLVAGLLAWAIGEATYGLFVWNDAGPIKQAYKSELSKLGPYAQSEFITQKMAAARPVAESRNTAIALGALGALLGLALGLVGGRLSGSRHSDNRGALYGSILGAVAAVVMSFILVPIYFQQTGPESGLAVPLLVYGGILIPLGAACGAGLGFGLGGRDTIIRSALGGLMGALLATIVIEMTYAIAFALEQEPNPISSDRLARLVLHLCTALFVAGFAALGTTGRSAEPSAHGA